MTTVCINLVPFERRHAARRRVRRRGWLTACAVYALGGINAGTARRLMVSNRAGFAGIGGLAGS